MMFPKITSFSGAMAAALLFAICIATPAGAQAVTALQLPATVTSSDGLLTVTLSSANPSDAVNVNNTFTWTATNNSTTDTLTRVVLGSHWGDYCVGSPGILGDACTIAFPEGPTLVSLASGCGGQSAGDLPGSNVAVFGVWCSPSTGVSLPPGASISGSVTVRPRTSGPAFYTVYSSHDPITGPLPPNPPLAPEIDYRGMVAPEPTDLQITGAASTGTPAIGSIFTYTYQIKNAGPWGTYGNVIFADALPSSITYVSSSVVQGALDKTTDPPSPITFTSTNVCSAVGQTVVCPLHDLTIGGTSNQATITLTVLASNTPQQIVNTATVHTVAPLDDSNTNNNSVTVTVTSK